MPARQILSAWLLRARFSVLARRAVDYSCHTADQRAGHHLTGHDLSTRMSSRSARHGAQVQYSPEAIQRAAKMHCGPRSGAENIPVSGLNRGAGALREVRVKRDEIVQLSVARAGAKEGVLPEITVRIWSALFSDPCQFGDVEAAEREFMQLLVIS